MKVLQSGMCGFLFAAILVKTRNLWAVALIHAATDYLLLFIENGLESKEVSTEYVATGTEGVEILVVYCVICALYIPFLVVGKRLIDQASPWRGAFIHDAGPVPAAAAAAPAGMPGRTPSPLGAIPVATPVPQPSSGIPATANPPQPMWPMQPTPAVCAGATQAPGAPYDAATAKAMRGKHAAPPRNTSLEGTRHVQDL